MRSDRLSINKIFNNIPYTALALVIKGKVIAMYIGGRHEQTRYLIKTRPEDSGTDDWLRF